MFSENKLQFVWEFLCSLIFEGRQLRGINLLRGRFFKFFSFCNVFSFIFLHHCKSWIVTIIFKAHCSTYLSENFHFSFLSYSNYTSVSISIKALKFMTMKGNWIKLYWAIIGAARSIILERESLLSPLGFSMEEGRKK